MKALQLLSTSQENTSLKHHYQTYQLEVLLTSKIYKCHLNPCTVAMQRAAGGPVTDTLPTELWSATKMWCNCLPGQVLWRAGLNEGGRVTLQLHQNSLSRVTSSQPQQLWSKLSNLTKWAMVLFKCTAFFLSVKRWKAYWLSELVQCGWVHFTVTPILQFLQVA